MNKNALLVASTAVALGLTSAVQADGVTVYSQFPQMDDGFPSDAVPGQYWDQRIADDFTLVSDTTLNGVRWIGGSENFLTDDLSNFVAFVIEFFADDGGAPGSSMFTTSALVGDTNPTFIGTDGFSGTQLFEHELKFNNLSLDAGTYYLSVGTVNLVADNDGWVWNNAANNVNNLLFAEIGVGSGFDAAPGFGDMAFELQAVPAPAGLAAIGLLGLLGRRRRRSA